MSLVPAGAWHHGIRHAGGNQYWLHWTTYTRYPGSRGLYPRGHSRLSDLKGATRFAKKWNITIPAQTADHEWGLEGDELRAYYCQLVASNPDVPFNEIIGCEDSIMNEDMHTCHKMALSCFEHDNQLDNWVEAWADAEAMFRCGEEFGPISTPNERYRGR